jgi:hypothetical protein
VKENSISFINNQFELAVKMNIPDTLIDTDEVDMNGTSKLAEKFLFKVTNEEQFIKNSNFYFTAFNVRNQTSIELFSWVNS